MTQALTCVGFDADDTLWHNERFFQMTQARFAGLLADHADHASLMTRLLAAERRNVGHYGYGIKGFTLSMIETAIEVTDGAVPAPVIREILRQGREMLRHPVELLPHARTAVETLSKTHTVVLITKGDLLDQERKIAGSGLDHLFDGIEIVSDKTPGAYARIFARYGDGPESGMMVGNSMRSDVVPMIEAGGWGVYVPHGHAWAMEHAEAPDQHPRFARIDDLSALSDLIGKLG